MSNITKITRRHVLKEGAAVGITCALSVAGVAHAQRKGQEPKGQSGEIIELTSGAEYDLSALQPGEMVAFKEGKNFIGVIHRSAAQIDLAQNANFSQDMTPDSERVVSDKFLVVNLRCGHRGCQVGYLGGADVMFQCPCHKTSFDASGRVLPEKAKTDQNLAFVPHRIKDNILTFAL